MLTKCFLLCNPELRAQVPLIITNTALLNTTWLYLISSLKYRLERAYLYSYLKEEDACKYKLNTYICKKKSGGGTVKNLC